MNSSFISNPSSSESTSFANDKRMKKAAAGGMKLSTDPQSVAARRRRHRISERFKILQSLVPGGSKMDTVSMLEEAIQYVQFLKNQIWLHQTMISLVDNPDGDPTAANLPSNNCSSSSFLPFYHQHFDNLCNNYSAYDQVQLGETRLGFSGVENVNFDASMRDKVI